MTRKVHTEERPSGPAEPGSPPVAGSGSDTPGAPEPARGQAHRAMLALARVEAWRLLRHPLVLLALLGMGVATMFLPGSPEDAYPVLHHADQDAQLSGLMVGLAGLVATNSAVSRAHRHGTERHFDVLELAPYQRTVAHALAALPLALAVTLLTLAAYLLHALRPGAVGHGSVAELLTSPALVLSLCALGALLGRLTRSALPAPLVAVLLIVVSFVFVGPADGSGWLAPTVYANAPEPLPAALLGRPAGWHLVYLLALGVLFTAAAGWFSGGRGRLVRAVLAGALVVAGTAGMLQTRGPSAELTAEREQATNNPATMQDCVRHGPTKYCAYAEFLPRAKEWHDVTQAVRALAPPPTREAPRTVRQRVDAVRASEGMSMSPNGWGTVGTTWGGAKLERDFAASFARTLVVDEDDRHARTHCDSRGVLINWLAAAAVNGTAGTDLPYDLVDYERGMLRELLRQPTDEVTQRVRQHWSELTQAGTSVTRAAELLDVTAPEASEIASAGDC